MVHGTRILRTRSTAPPRKTERDQHSWFPYVLGGTITLGPVALLIGLGHALVATCLGLTGVVLALLLALHRARRQTRAARQETERARSNAEAALALPRTFLRQRDVALALLFLRLDPAEKAAITRLLDLSCRTPR